MVELAQTRQQHEYASSVGLLTINLLWLYVIAQCGDCWKRNMKIKPRKTDPYLKLPFPFNSIDSLTCSTMPHTTVEHKRLVKIFNGCSSAGSCPTRFRDRPLAKLSEGGGGGFWSRKNCFRKQVLFENKSFT